MLLAQNKSSINVYWQEERRKGQKGREERREEGKEKREKTYKAFKNVIILTN